MCSPPFPPCRGRKRGPHGVAGLGAFHGDRAAEHVRVGEGDVADVVGGVVVADLVGGPVPALDAEVRARLDGDGGGCRAASGCGRVPSGRVVAHGHAWSTLKTTSGMGLSFVSGPGKRGEGSGKRAENSGNRAQGSGNRVCRGSAGGAGRGHLGDDARFVGAGLLGTQGASRGSGGAGEHRGGEDPAGLLAARCAGARPMSEVSSV